MFFQVFSIVVLFWINTTLPQQVVCFFFQKFTPCALNHKAHHNGLWSCWGFRAGFTNSLLILFLCFHETYHRILFQEPQIFMHFLFVKAKNTCWNYKSKFAPEIVSVLYPKGKDCLPTSNNQFSGASAVSSREAIGDTYCDFWWLFRDVHHEKAPNMAMFGVFLQGKHQIYVTFVLEVFTEFLADISTQQTPGKTSELTMPKKNDSSGDFS